MSQLGPKLRLSIAGLNYFCPGCNEMHGITIGEGGWSWNQDAERPTFSPSVLVTNGHYLDGHKDGDPCWCAFNAEHPDDPVPFSCKRCHCYVKDGRIEFLSDCSHSLRGKTVELPDLPGYNRDPVV